MISTSTSATERLTLYDMSWEGYETLLNSLGDRPTHTTYPWKLPFPPDSNQWISAGEQ
ncbi:hypothetical protein [Leptodesmis sichuanensis]|uniref:hypothetical protein n=1 Tax=Leptodesmis sichuanensis TaxID=2906798 RepID=UPI001F34BC4D|nr:hypothetical protein [Leptodesmis sichuanensis]UIE39252.1 hypothetical protein KIK02_06635 [Leptodesmis sichuanensis A121]